MWLYYNIASLLSTSVIIIWNKMLTLLIWQWPCNLTWFVRIEQERALKPPNTPPIKSGHGKFCSGQPHVSVKLGSNTLLFLHRIPLCTVGGGKRVEQKSGKGWVVLLWEGAQGVPTCTNDLEIITTLDLLLLTASFLVRSECLLG